MDTGVARSIAHQSHIGQRTRHGTLMSEHVERVAAAVSEEARAVAFLHDVLEKTETRLEELHVSGLTTVEREALYLLTRGDDENFDLHALRIAHAAGQAGQIARAIKLADLEDHISRKRSRHRRAALRLGAAAHPRGAGAPRRDGLVHNSPTGSSGAGPSLAGRWRHCTRPRPRGSRSCPAARSRRRSMSGWPPWRTSARTRGGWSPTHTCRAAPGGGSATCTTPCGSPRGWTPAGGIGRRAIARGLDTLEVFAGYCARPRDRAPKRSTSSPRARSATPPTAGPARPRRTMRPASACGCCRSRKRPATATWRRSTRPR